MKLRVFLQSCTRLGGRGNACEVSMSKLNFEQPTRRTRDIGGPPGWVLMLVADILIAGVAGLTLMHTAF
jgi:hypothetical protein